MGSAAKSAQNTGEKGSEEKQPETPKSQSKFARAFERAVGRARWLGYAERMWERAAPTVGGLTGVFLTASWAGLWQNVQPSVRMTGVVLFAAALATAIRPLTKLAKPTRDEALARLDKESGFDDRPASTYDDIPVNEEYMNEETKALWRTQRQRIEDKVGEFSAGGFQSNLAKRDPFALRFVLLLATALSFGVATSQDQQVERVAAAFDWSMQPPATEPTKIDAWLSPPVYTDEQPMYLSETDSRSAAASGSEFTVPARSVLRLNVHDKDAQITVTGGMSPVEGSCEAFEYNDTQRCEFELTSNATITVDRGAHEPLRWTFNVTADLPPRISVAPAAPEAEGEQPGIDVTIEDEYGADISNGRIRPVQPEDPDAQKLPLYDLPSITITPSK